MKLRDQRALLKNDNQVFTSDRGVPVEQSG
jgi:hypothetical protein